MISYTGIDNIVKRGSYHDMIESASAWIACQLLKKGTRNRHINSHMHLLVQYSSVSLTVEDGRRLKEVQFETYYSLNMFNQPQPLNQFP